MVWVDSEYAGELAVLSTWVCTLLPWNVTFSSIDGVGSVLFVRFPFFQIRYTFGIPFARAVSVRDPLSAIQFQAGQSLELGYQVWAAAAAVMALALVFSVVYYLREARVERGPVDPVRLLGTLLGATGGLLAASTYLIATRGFPGIPLPVGVIFLLLFGGVLLTVERT